MALVSSATPVRNHHPVAAEQSIPAPDVFLAATLTVPLGAHGIVVLLHASSAGRFERGHRFSAEVLEQSGLATLQVDLLTPEEEASFPLRSQEKPQVKLLVARILAVIQWLQNHPDANHLAMGFFASTTETVAALVAAERSGRVVAIVSKGGCPDLGDDAMTHLSGPTLLLLGANELARAEELAAEFFGRHLNQRAG